MAKMSPDYRACPTPRMLFRSSLAFRVQVWLIARVAGYLHAMAWSQMHLLVSRITHCRDEIAVIKLHIYAGKRLKWMTSIKVVGLNIISHPCGMWNLF